MLCRIVLCIFLVSLIEAAHAVSQRSHGRPSKIPGYKVGNANEEEEEYSEMIDEELEGLPEIDEEGLPHGASLVNEADQPYRVGTTKQVDRNKPKRKGFDYEARKTTPFRYVDTTAEKRPKRGSGKKSDDDSETVEDDDDESASDEKEPRSGSNDEDEDEEKEKEKEKKSSSKGKGKERKGKSKKKSDEDEDDYSDSAFGVLNAKTHLMLWTAIGTLAWKLLFDASI